MTRPVGLGVAADGRVYVVDFGNRRVSVFTNAGRYLFSFDTTADGKLRNAVHLAVKGNEVWVSERFFRTIYVFDLEGKYLRKFTPKNETLKWTPLAFSFDASGALRVTDVGNTKKHRLVYFSEDGSRTAMVGKTAQVNSLEDQPGTFLFPNGVAVDPRGEVYVSDGNNRRVQVFDKNGTFLRFVDTSGVPRGIAIDAKERLYVADALAHTVAVFDLDGKLLTQFGERGFGPGQFNYPNDITTVKRNRIYITDRENNQVQVWGWPVAQVPAIPVPPAQYAWLVLCCIPLALLPLLLLARRKVRIVVTPDFMAGLELFEEIRPVAEKARVRLIAPIEDRPLYEGREVDGIDLGQLLTFEEYSESDARALMAKLKVAERPAMLLAMAWRAKALATDDNDLRLLALLAEVRTVDVQEFREIYLKREIGRSEGTNE
jgi:DNA-binding beta-propeller fold protein YncE